MGMLVDVSGSQETVLRTEQHAGAAFFRKVLRKKDLAFLISFGPEVELMQDYTASPDYLQRALDRLEIRGGTPNVGLPGPVPTIGQPRGTVLYDAVWLAAREKLNGEVGRKALILLTDGVDMGSRVSRDDAIEAAQKADAIIYSIYYVDPRMYAGTGFWPSSGDLKKLSEETGGRLFEVDRKFSLDEVFSQIQEELRSQYAIGYNPTNPSKDGSFRKVEIKAKRKDVKVQARKGYFATRS
jgi:VWFA-related protein